ncbi:hypothetical protein BHU72_15095 [Desulfuribacillus stibiiarsenatis]|uniref:Branched-chain amino acid ABC transporter n=1 Tax=Desulfuribacillus stibiiarsenatis TaxID=1390249 RepID=A0A1E5L607_9FIRM|nr:AzlD domain-containing protein [Desulfuribacillus stibiiarsenatis]OEH85546.1 hypothetical protein BHU72_15095 [Desulfuribacillus stibiiarsenatis]
MENSLILLILGMALVTYVPRAIPMIFLSDRDLPSWVNEWLGYIPVTVLSALLFPILFMKDQEVAISNNIYLIAALPTFIMGFITKNIFVTVLVGMGSVVLLRVIM